MGAELIVFSAGPAECVVTCSIEQRRAPMASRLALEMEVANVE